VSISDNSIEVGTQDGQVYLAFCDGTKQEIARQLLSAQAARQLAALICHAIEKLA
jgi:hypothetical protein